MSAPDLDRTQLTQWHDRNRQIIHLVDEIERLRERITIRERWLRRTAHVLKIVANDRNAAKERERITAAAYIGQQHAYRELEALYSAMTERAMQAELALKMTRAQLHNSEQSGEALRRELDQRRRMAVNGLYIRHDHYQGMHAETQRLRAVAQAARAFRQHLPPDKNQTNEEQALCAALDKLHEVVNE